MIIWDTGWDVLDVCMHVCTVVKNAMSLECVLCAKFRQRGSRKEKKKNRPMHDILVSSYQPATF